MRRERSRPGWRRIDLLQKFVQERHLPQRLDVEKSGPQAVVDVMSVIGDIVGDGGGLGLAAGMGRQFEVLPGVVFEDRQRHSARRIAQGRIARRIEKRAIMLDQPLEGFPSEIEAIVIRIATLEPGDDPQSLGVVVETAECRHARFQHILAGMAEGRMAEVVRQGQRLRQILIEPEGAGERAGDLADLDGMGQAGAEMIALMIDEDLGLVLEPAEGRGMDDPVPVALEFAARRR